MKNPLAGRRSPQIVIITMLLLSIPALYYYCRQRCADNMEAYFAATDPSLLTYKQYQRMFGDSPFLAVVFCDHDVFTNANISFIRQATEKIGAIDGVKSVLSLTSANLAFAEADRVDFRAIIPEDESLSPEQLALARQSVMSRPLLVGSLISKDGTTSALMVELKGADGAASQEIMEKIEAQANALAAGRLTLHFAGTPRVEAEINRLLHRNNILFTALFVLLASAMTYATLRSLSLTLIALCETLLVGIWIVGGGTAAGIAINMMNIAILPLALSSTLAISCFILLRLRRLEEGHVGERTACLAQLMREEWLTVLLSLLLVACCHAAFLISPLYALHKLGTYGLYAFCITSLFTVGWLPATLMLRASTCSPKKGEISSAESNSSTSRLGPITVTAQRYRFVLLGLALTICAAAALKVRTVSIDNNLARFIRDDNSVKADMAFIDTHLAGTLPVEFIFKTGPSAATFVDPAQLNRLETVRRAIFGHMQEEFTGTLSIIDYLKEMNQAFNAGKANGAWGLPLTTAEVSDDLELMGLSDEQGLAKTITADRKWVRVSFSSHFNLPPFTHKLEAFLESTVKDLLSGLITCERIGIGLLQKRLDQLVHESIFVSFFSSLCIIAIVLWAALRSTLLAILAVLVGLMPALTVLGLMAAAGIPFNAVTVMTGSFALGLSTFCSAALLVGSRAEIRKGSRPAAAIIASLARRGKDCLRASLILLLGPLVLCFSSLRPISHFGIFLGLAVLLAVPSYLVTMPALVSVFFPDTKS